MVFHPTASHAIPSLCVPNGVRFGTATGPWSLILGGMPIYKDHAEISSPKELLALLFSRNYVRIPYGHINMADIQDMALFRSFCSKTYTIWNISEVSPIHFYQFAFTAGRSSHLCDRSASVPQQI